jgi:hypothetical protein
MYNKEVQEVGVELGCGVGLWGLGCGFGLWVWVVELGVWVWVVELGVWFAGVQLKSNARKRIKVEMEKLRDDSVPNATLSNMTWRAVVGYSY